MSEPSPSRLGDRGAALPAKVSPLMEASRAMAGTAYGTYLACGAYQDLCSPIPNCSRLTESLQPLLTGEGGYTNELVASGPDAPSGPLRPSTNATAAALSVLNELGAPFQHRTADWLLAQAHHKGGFVATSSTPLPDLLSTATSLHALASAGVSVSEIRDKCLDFIDSLWTNQGGFYGHWGDDRLDCEYTFYGLLALGHLA